MFQGYVFYLYLKVSFSNAENFLATTHSAGLLVLRIVGASVGHVFQDVLCGSQVLAYAARQRANPGLYTNNPRNRPSWLSHIPMFLYPRHQFFGKPIVTIPKFEVYEIGHFPRNGMM